MRRAKTRNLYLVPAAGAVDINGVRVNARDGAAIRDEARLTITALEDSEWCWSTRRKPDQRSHNGTSMRGLAPAHHLASDQPRINQTTRKPTETDHAKSSSAVLFRLRSYRDHGECRRRGRPRSRRFSRHQAGTRTGAAGCRESVILQSRSGRTGREDRRPRQLRRRSLSAPAPVSGRMSSQMANFSTRPAAFGPRARCRQSRRAFTSTATQHGGQETTLFSIITNLLHFGMIIVGLITVLPAR